MGGNDPELDRRPITQLLLDQVEFANVIVVSKAALFLGTRTERQLQEVAALLRRLSPKARVIVPREDRFGDLDVGQALLHTGLFDMESASRSAGWLVELAKEGHAAETEEYGVSSLTFRSNAMPFHPARLGQLIDGFGDYASVLGGHQREGDAGEGKGEGGPREDRTFKGVVRAKGRLWLANANVSSMEIHTAGRHLSIHPADTPFLAAVIDKDWGVEQNRKKNSVRSELIKAGKWSPKFGDRHSEFVCIGVNMDKQLIRERLTAALLTEDESEALGGMGGWGALTDPLFANQRHTVEAVLHVSTK
jgi:G3E family GTPase